MRNPATGDQLYECSRPAAICFHVVERAAAHGLACTSCRKSAETQPFKRWSSVSISRHGRAATVWSLPGEQHGRPLAQHARARRLRPGLESNRNTLAAGVGDPAPRAAGGVGVGSGVGGSTGGVGAAAAGAGVAVGALGAVTRGVTAGVG